MEAVVHLIVEAVMRKLPPSHSSLMARSGRLVWIKSVLRAVPIYAMMANSLPAWVQKEIDSVCRHFLWVGSDASIRGKCMVAWKTVCKPTELGGLGVSDLKLQGFVLQSRWLWLQRTDQERAWSQLPLHTAPEVKAFFKASMFMVLGDGRQVLFWEHKWIDGKSVHDIAPLIH